MMRLLTSSRIMSVPGAALGEPSPLRAPGTRPSLRRRFRSRARASLPARCRRRPRPPGMTSQASSAPRRAGNWGRGCPLNSVGHGLGGKYGGTQEEGWTGGARDMGITASWGEAGYWVCLGYGSPQKCGVLLPR